MKEIICGTGHRPNKLRGYSIESFYDIELVAIDWLEELGGDRRDNLLLISGGALGWDQALACVANRWSVMYKMYLPFPEFDSKWPKESRNFLSNLCNSAVEVKYICDAGYAPWKMQKRNEAMVNDSDSVIALWNGSPGGTGNCVKYAEKVNKPVRNLWKEYEEILRERV